MHNYYTDRGGEDSVVLNERELLKSKGHCVEELYVSSSEYLGRRKWLIPIMMFINPFLWMKFVTTLIRFKPDVIHCHNIYPLLSPSLYVIAYFFRVRVVQTLHNYRMVCSNSKLLLNNEVCFRCVKRKMPISMLRHKCNKNSYVLTLMSFVFFRFYNLIGALRLPNLSYIVFSESMKEIFVNSFLNIPDKQFHVKPNFAPYKASHNQSRRKFFLFVGRLSPEKGIDVLLESFSQTSHELLIVGDGPMRELVMKKAKKHANIIYQGVKSSGDVLYLMKNAKALILPSIWLEGMPMTMIEAMSVGCPVIGSQIGTISETINHGKNGLLFKTGSPLDLLKCLDLCNSSMHSYARETYIKKFSPDVNYKKLLDIYTGT